jgi:hypothetical protein
MKLGAFLWMIVFVLAAMTFFVVAAIVAFKGSVDLKDLLRNSTKQSREH